MVQERDIFIHISRDCLQSCDYTGDKLIVFALLFNYGKQGKGLTVSQIQELYCRILKRQLFRYLNEMLNDGKIIKSGKGVYQSVTMTPQSVNKTPQSVTMTPQSVKKTLSHLIYSNKYNKYNKYNQTLSLSAHTCAREEKREREEDKIELLTHVNGEEKKDYFYPKKFVAWWNSNIKLAPIVDLTEQQKSTICNYICKFGKDDFTNALSYASTKSFYTGESDGASRRFCSTKKDIIYILQEENFLRLLAESRAYYNEKMKKPAVKPVVPGVELLTPAEMYDRFGVYNKKGYCVVEFEGGRNYACLYEKAKEAGLQVKFVL